MSLVDIKHLKGAAYILNRFPHLKGAQVDPRFDKVGQLKDKSFVIKSSTDKKYFAINIEEGRKSVHPNNDLPYCQKGEETDDCATWRGDLKADPFFIPGPDKNIGKTEHINWDKKVRGPAWWVWAIIVFLVWRTLS